MFRPSRPHFDLRRGTDFEPLTLPWAASRIRGPGMALVVGQPMLATLPRPRLVLSARVKEGATVGPHWRLVESACHHQQPGLFDPRGHLGDGYGRLRRWWGVTRWGTNFESTLWGTNFDSV